jgi:hypothetical protein
MSSNYQEGPEGQPSQGGQGYQGGQDYRGGADSGYEGGSTSYEGQPGYQTGHAYQGPGGYQGQGYQGQGYQGQGGYQGGPHHETAQFHGPGPQWQGDHGRGGRRPQVRSTFTSTEFWAYVVVSIAVLIAAAVTDNGADDQGFGARQAWWYVTLLTIGYLISRALTKLGRGRGDNHDGDHDSAHR